MAKFYPIFCEKKLLPENNVVDNSDDQLYYTKCFLEKIFDIKLDYYCEIFQ